MPTRQSLAHVPTPDAPMRHWLVRALERDAEAAALEADGLRWSYAALSHRLAGLGAALAGAGLPPGAVLATRSRSRPLTALLAYAALPQDFVLQPINPALPAATQAELLALTGARYLVSDTPSAPAEGLRVLDAEVLWWQAAGAGAGAPPSAAPGDEQGPRLVIATSGSSGRPKAVMLSEANLAASVRASRRCLPLGPGDRWLLCLPLHHIGGLSVLFRCLEAGATAVLAPGFDARRVWQSLQEAAVTHVSLVPAMLARLLEVAGDAPAPASLKAALIGGGPLDPQLLRRARAAGWPLCVSYGLSEAASQVATLCLGPGDADPPPGLVGPPLPGVELCVVDAAGRPTADEGRIRLRGPSVMLGYARPGLQPGEGLHGGWLETGDLGRLDAEGRLQVLGRHDDVIVSGGENIHPLQVEALLSACPGLREAAVAGAPDPVWGERVTAVVAGDVDLEALEAWCRARLPGLLRPRAFIRVPALPRLSNGKLDRSALKALVRAQAAR